jgi:enoyl-CoA hydratase/carnithine racemase
MALTARTRTPPDVSNILYNIRTGEKEWQLINSERVGDVAVLTLDDRARRNALSHDMSVALAKAVDRALADDAKAIVLGATPPVFCSGGLVARTKASLRASGEVSGAAAAVELELEAQEWSVSRPGFVERVTALRDGLRTRQNNRR